MPLSLTCACGKTLRARDEHAGRKTKCPACGQILAIPLPSPVHTGDRSENAGTTAVAPPNRPAASDDPPEVLPAEPEVAISERVSRRPLREDHDDPEERRSRARGRGSRRDKPADDGGLFAPEKSMFNGGILGGLGLMAIAAVWFFGAALLFDVWFFYPPILFIIGVAAFIKGLLDLGRRI